MRTSAGIHTVSFIGAGLSSALAALAIRKRHPKSKVQIFEVHSQMPPQRTWSFHKNDIEESMPEISRFVTHSWQGYEIYFPKYSRSFESTYCALKPEHLQKTLEEAGVQLYFNSKAESIGENEIKLSNGSRFNSDCVIDGRGYSGKGSERIGVQKFLGLELALEEPHTLARPILMDANVPQTDGYRFFYVLPLSENKLLVEDTRYTSDSDLDRALLRREVLNYCEQRGWKIQNILSEEAGVLPIPLDLAAVSEGAVPKIGMAGGFFHPVTGYSLPDAARIANLIAKIEKVTTKAVRLALASYRRDRASLTAYYLMLNRMMFLAAEPEERRKIFEHFYKQREPTVQRFYAGNSTIADRLKILSGRPPVSVLPALRAMASKGESPR